MRFLLLFLIALWFFPCSRAPVFALNDPGTQLNDVGVNPILGSKVDLERTFTDSDGKIVTLRQLMADGRPTILVPVYYDCPRLCGLVMNGVVELLNALTLTLGSDYRVIAVSFNASEKPEQAAERRTYYDAKLQGAAHDSSGWHFLVGEEQNIRTLMSQIGFRYAKDGDEYAHTSAIILLTPDGEISQYFTGIDYPAWDVRLALVEASKGNIGSPLDHVLLFCFRFDQTKGKYTWAVVNMLRVGGALTLFSLSFLILRLYRREKLAVSS